MSPTPCAPLPRPPLDQSAFFLDLDGTLAPIAARPELACIPSATLQLLAKLHDATQGAVAVVSGRDATTLDSMLSPLRLVFAASHGAQLRDPTGNTTITVKNLSALGDIAQALADVVVNLPGALLEKKTMSVALHYRGAAKHEAAIHEIARRLLADYRDAFELQEGKMVIEFKPRGASKGAALRHLMTLPPFTGRTPFMAGDDITDESAFEATNDLGGISVKIGDGPTMAQYRLSDPAALASWLGAYFPD